MRNYILFGLLALFLIYMIIWTIKLASHSKRQKKVKRMQELRAKGNEIKRRTIDCTKDYWYNLREIEDCKEGEDFEKYYHYFVGVNQGVEELLLEMYDCGIVRTDELEEIAYGKNNTRNVDLSFLEQLERELKEEEEALEEAEKAEEEDNLFVGSSGMVQIDVDDEDEEYEEEYEEDYDEDGEALEDDIEEGEEADAEDDEDALVAASKKLKEDDPGITDIYGTLSTGVIDVIEAAEAEKKAQEEKDEPIIKKEAKSIEELREVRERTSNAAIRNKIYEKWVSYVFELYELVNINANEDTKHKIRKALMDYGYNDIDVLLESPE